MRKAVDTSATLGGKSHDWECRPETETAVSLVGCRIPVTDQRRRGNLTATSTISESGMSKIRMVVSISGFGWKKCLYRALHELSGGFWAEPTVLRVEEEAH